MARREQGPRVLRDWREAQNPRVSQKQVGLWIGVGASRVSHYETELEELPTHHKVEISKQTGIPLQRLLTRTQRLVVFEAAELLETAA